jgi:hypothetical protein
MHGGAQVKKLLAALLLAAAPAFAQWDDIVAGWSEIQTPPSSLPSLAGNTGKVLAVNGGETGTEWVAAPAAGAAGADTQLQFNDGGAVLAGTDGLTWTKASKSLSLVGPFTLTPLTDLVPLTARAYSSGTNHIFQWQTSANGALGHIAHDGSITAPAVSATTFTGALTGNASTASDGLTSASGTAPLTLNLAAKALTGSVATMTAASAGSGGAAGLVPASSAGDQAKYLRADATWQTVSGGGVTNSAGANVLAKSDGTNLVASGLTEASAGAVATTAGTALGLTATAPAATTGASQAGKAVTITASPAVASTDTNGSARGGDVTISGGNAANRTSGDADGGAINLYAGQSVGTATWATGPLQRGYINVYGFIRGAGFGSALTGVLIGGAGNNNTSRPLTWYDGGLWVGTLSVDGVWVKNTGYIGFSSAATETNTGDTYFRRKAAANPAWGAASGTPTAYTHTLAADGRSGTDTNVGGANATITSGIGTGTGTPSTLTISTPATTTSGTGAQTATARAIFGPNGVNLPNLPTYADNAAATTGGLAAGDVYRTSTGVLMVRY